MSYKILVVEDDLDIQELIVEFLETKQYIVTTANDGVEGFKCFQKDQFDLILLDVMMPNMDGLSLSEMIRKKSNVPIIFLTALGEEQNHLKAFNIGADDYIVKPFSFAIFLKRVEALLRRTYGERNVLIFNEIVLDLDGFTVKVNDEFVELTTKEFEILKILMSNKQKVLSRDALLNMAWDYEYFGEHRVVDVHIKNLRKKLNVSYIKTVKGVGYKIDD